MLKRHFKKIIKGEHALFKDPPFHPYPPFPLDVFVHFLRTPHPHTFRACVLFEWPQKKL